MKQSERCQAALRILLRCGRDPDVVVFWGVMLIALAGSPFVCAWLWG